MDPNANLKEQRELVKALFSPSYEKVDWCWSASRLAELVMALDQWLTGGGFLPNNWNMASRQRYQPSADKDEETQ